MTPADLADSLRAMHRCARQHYTPTGHPPRVSVVMEPWRLQHLLAAADALVQAGEQQAAASDLVEGVAS